MAKRETCTPSEEAFAVAYVAGPEGLRSNALRSYRHAYPNCHSDVAAGTNAHRLLKRDRVRARMRQLRDEASAEARKRLRDWWHLAPDAQDTLELAAAGLLPVSWSDERIRSAVKAAMYVIDRCEGKPEQRGRLEAVGGFVVQVAGAHEPDQVQQLPPAQAGRVIELAGDLEATG